MDKITVLDNLRHDAYGHKWQMHEGQLREAVKAALAAQGGSVEGFGVKRWPDAGVGIGTGGVVLANTVVYVLPRNPSRVGYGKSGMKLRARAICAYCGADVPAGRLHQHQKAKACRAAKADYHDSQWDIVPASTLNPNEVV